MRWRRWRKRSRITKVRSERVSCFRVRISSVWDRSSAIGEPSSASSRKTQGLQANGSPRFWGIVANKTGVWKRFVGPSMSRDWPGTHGQVALTKNDEAPTWLIVSFGEHERVFCPPRLGSARNRPAGGSSDTCYPSIPLQRPGASASSPPRVTKSDDDPTSFTSVGSLADSPEPPLRPSPATRHAAEILDV